MPAHSLAAEVEKITLNVSPELTRLDRIVLVNVKLIQSAIGIAATG
jgi:hypothetical protein